MAYTLRRPFLIGALLGLLGPVLAACETERPSPPTAPVLTEEQRAEVKRRVGTAIAKAKELDAKLKP